MRHKIVLLLFPIFINVGHAWSQQIGLFESKKWKQLSTSDSIPKMLIYRLGRFGDGYFQIADRDKPFQATDVIYDRTLPKRQLRYLGRNGNEWLLTYKHGGWGLHYHFVFYKVEDGTVKALMNGVTSNQLETLEDINNAILKSAIDFKELLSDKETDKV